MFLRLNYETKRNEYKLEVEYKIERSSDGYSYEIIDLNIEQYDEYKKLTQSIIDDCNRFAEKYISKNFDSLVYQYEQEEREAAEERQMDFYREEC